MKNKFNLRDYIEGIHLPVAAKGIFKEILACCREEIEKNPFFINLAKSRSQDSIPKLLEYVLISVGDAAHKVKHIDGDEHLKNVADLMAGRNANHETFEAVPLRSIDNYFRGLGYGRLGIKGAFEDQLRMALAILLVLGIDEIAHLEETLTRELNNDYYQIAKQLDPEISEIVSMYLRLKIAPVVTKYMSKVIDEKTANSNKGRTKSGKEKLFGSFIEWALALPEDHGYQYPIHAARHYHKLLKESGDKELVEMAKQIQIDGKTPRVMCEKLDIYCKDKSIQNPLKPCSH